MKPRIKTTATKRTNAAKKINAYKEELERMAQDDGRGYMLAVFLPSEKREVGSAVWNSLLWARSTNALASVLECNIAEHNNEQYAVARIVTRGNAVNGAQVCIVGTRAGYSAHRKTGSVKMTDDYWAAVSGVDNAQDIADDAFLYDNVVPADGMIVLVIADDNTQAYRANVTNDTDETQPTLAELLLHVIDADADADADNA